MTKCDVCRITNAILNGRHAKVFGIRICGECQLLDKYNIICKTDIKSKYSLKLDELSNLNKYEYWDDWNGYTRTYYLVNDINRFYMTKYNIKYEEIHNHIIELKEAKQKMRKEIIKKI